MSHAQTCHLGTPASRSLSLTAHAVPDPPFRSPRCGGQVIQNQTVTLGCVPLSPAVMEDFQDFVNFLAGLL